MSMKSILSISSCTDECPSSPVRSVTFDPVVEHRESPRNNEPPRNTDRPRRTSPAPDQVWSSLIGSHICPGCHIDVRGQCSSGNNQPDGPTCDNSKWKWNGEPPFCCMCAKRRSIGSFTALGCDGCKTFRSTTFVRKSRFMSSTCRGCGIKAEQHVNGTVAGRQGKFLLCPSPSCASS